MAREEIAGVSVPQAELSADAGTISRGLMTTLAAGGAAVLAVIGLGVYKAEAGGSGPADSRTPVTGSIDLSTCTNPSFEVLPPASADSEAVMPASDLTSNDATAKAQAAWFKSGPLGTKVDKGVLAVMDAVTAIPASTNKDGTERAGTAYQAWFSTALASANSGGAEAECKAVGTLMQQDTEYGTFVSGPGAVVEVVPSRGSDGDINNIQLMPVTAAAAQELKGAIYQKGDTSKDEFDYAEVLETPDGRIFMKGVSPTPKQGNQEQKNNGKGGGSSSANSKAPAGSGNGQQVGPNGTTPENLPNGPLTGPTGTGPSAPGGPAEAAPGPGQTPGPGGPGTPTETVPETPTTPPPTAPPTTSSPTTVPKSTTTSPPTTVPKSTTTTPPTTAYKDPAPSTTVPGWGA